MRLSSASKNKNCEVNGKLSLMLSYLVGEEVLPRKYGEAYERRATFPPSSDLFGRMRISLRGSQVAIKI